MHCLRVKLQAMYYNVILRRFRGNLLPLKSNIHVHIHIIYIFWTCVSVCACARARSSIYPACKMHEPYYTVICILSDSNIFFHVISQTAWFSDKILLNINMVWFSLQILSETFLVLTGIQRDTIIDVKSIYLNFNKTWIFSTAYLKKLKHEI
jgi:hypothetical protein